MFKNTRTGATAMELQAYKTEDEATALARLKAAGWNFNIDYYWDDNAKMFVAGKEDDEADSDEVEGDE